MRVPFSFNSAPPVILVRIPVQDIIADVDSLLRCHIDRGSPLGSIYWLKIDNDTGNLYELTANSDPRFHIVENGLEIRSVRISDEGMYRCYVYNQQGSDFFDIQALYRGENTHNNEFYPTTLPFT